MAIGVLVFGPLVATLLILLKAIRKLMPGAALPFRPFEVDQPPNGGDLAGDREPRRPLTPTRSGAVALALPNEEDEPGTDFGLPRRAPGEIGGDDGGHRLAG